MVRIDSISQARDLLAAAVAARGSGYRDDNAQLGTCRYASDGRPSCIIGHVLHGAGWSMAELEATDEDSLNVFELERAHPELFGPGVAVALQAAQDEQDSGESWGRALEAFLAITSEEK